LGLASPSSWPKLSDDGGPAASSTGGAAASPSN
jgi:hypothetical protein